MLLLLQLLVLDLLKPGPDGQHFLLQLAGAQLINVQHERKLDVLHDAKKEACFIYLSLFEAVKLKWLPRKSRNQTLRTFALTASFSL